MHDELWDKAEKSFRNCSESERYQMGINPGQGAFYGPKIEFSLRDCLSRVWQCGTLQVDFSMPQDWALITLLKMAARNLP